MSSKQLPPIHTYTSRQKLINEIILLSLLSRCEFGKRINVCCKKASQMLVINCVNTEENIRFVHSMRKRTRELIEQ